MARKEKKREIRGRYDGTEDFVPPDRTSQLFNLHTQHHDKSGNSTPIDMGRLRSDLASDESPRRDRGYRKIARKVISGGPIPQELILLLPIGLLDPDLQIRRHVSKTLITAVKNTRLPGSVILALASASLDSDPTVAKNSQIALEAIPKRARLKRMPLEDIEGGLNPKKPLKE